MRPVGGVTVQVLLVLTGAEDHHLAGVHPVVLGVGQQHGVGDGEEVRVGQDVEKRRAAVREAGEAHGALAPEVAHVLVVGHGADPVPGGVGDHVVAEAVEEVRREEVLHDHRPIGVERVQRRVDAAQSWRIASSPTT